MIRFDLEALKAWDARPYVIAEAGVNHGGDRAVALEMIHAAAGSGVDAIKFQTYKAGRLATRSSEAYWDRSKESSGSQYELFARYDALDADDYRALADACAAAGVDFLSTPFDVETVDWLAPLMPAIKIASADITNAVLLRRIGEAGKPVLLSTGASTLDEVRDAVALLDASGADGIGVLHCTLAYPTASRDAALGALVALRAAFPAHVLGYSDHTLPADSFEAIPAAVALGARVIEKHFTLDASKPGNDHYHAFEPHQFAELRVRLEALHAMLGEPVKAVLPAEEAARTHARRSLVTRVAIARGAAITPDFVDVKRPGHGIPPGELETVLGRRAAVDIAEDTTLQWDMLDGGDGAP